MPAVVPFIPLIVGGVQAGTQIAANRSQSRANREANQIDARNTDLALQEAREQRDYDRRQSEEDRRLGLARDEREYGYRSGRDAISDARFNDERDYGRGEFASYKSRLAPFSNAGARSMANLSSVVGRNLPAAIPTTGAGGMVRLQSPTGQVQEVPADHLDWYLSKGAKRV